MSKMYMQLQFILAKFGNFRPKNRMQDREYVQRQSLIWVLGKYKKIPFYSFHKIWQLDSQYLATTAII
jgi:hypothetical protein